MNWKRIDQRDTPGGCGARGAIRGGVHFVCRGVVSISLAIPWRSKARIPPLIRFTGRTKYFLSAFGEHLISEEVEKGVAHAAQVCGVRCTRFPCGRRVFHRSNQTGPPPYLIEFAGPSPDTRRFASELDEETEPDQRRLRGPPQG